MTSDVVPASPPPEVQAQVSEALQRAHDLFARNCDLHFAKDPERGRMVMQVRDLEGNVLRTLPPLAALDLLTGGRGDLGAPDDLGDVGAMVESSGSGGPARPSRAAPSSAGRRRA